MAIRRLEKKIVRNYIQSFESGNQVNFFGENSKSLSDCLELHDEYQVHTISGIKDIMTKFK